MTMVLHALVMEVSDRICTLTINRPDKLNALNAQVKQELADVFAHLKTDRSVDVVILTGAGEKAFVAGTDIGELTALTEQSGREFSSRGQEVFNLIEHCGKPVIAAVNGYALGGGCELAMACHIRFAADTAKFGQPEVNLGIIPGYGGTQRLARLAGKGAAMEMILSGNPLTAAEALRMGLVNRVVPQAELLTEVRAFARVIASKGQIAVRHALEAVNAGEGVTPEEGLRREAGLFGRCCGSEDFREGTAAFMEKRKPVFKNR